MSLFYVTQPRGEFRRYVGLSCVLHVTFIAAAWYVLQQQVRMIKTTGVEISIRTVPGMRKSAAPGKPGAMPMPALPQAAPRRKIGRIIEKRFKFDMPRIEPQSSMRRAPREDEIQLVKDKSITRLLRSENVEMLDVDRKEAYKPATPNLPSPPQSAARGEYIPQTAQPNVNVEVEYVEIPFETARIDLDSLDWKPAIAMQQPGQTVSNSPNPAGAPSQPGKRQVVRQILPELPSNHGVQESRVEVIIRVMIEENGFISKAEIEQSGGYLELDNRALAAIRQWIYANSTKREERLVKVKYEIP